MVFDQQILAQFRSYLPQLSKEEQDFVNSLPTSYKLHVPYFAQEQKHWSGAAVAKMLHAYHRKESEEQSAIAAEAGLEDWRSTNHETLKEDFVRYMVRKNYVPSVYYPGRYVLPQFKTGIEGADFIAENYELVNDVGFLYFKALMVKARAPVMVRIHFHTGMYPMPEEMAAVIDTCGHALLLVGYDESGFFVHDPWNMQEWGGSHGGRDMHVSYDELAARPTVNCCLGQVEEFSVLKAEIDYPRVAIVPGRDIEIVLRVEIPGIGGISSDIYPIEGFTAQLRLGDPLQLRSPSVTTTAMPRLFSGARATCKWTVNTGSKPGSYPIEVLVRAPLQLKSFGWEKNAVDEVISVSTVARRRLDVKDKGWINRYGRT